MHQAYGPQEPPVTTIVQPGAYRVYDRGGNFGGVLVVEGNNNWMPELKYTCRWAGTGTSFEIPADEMDKLNLEEAQWPKTVTA